ncbi:MAG: ribonuclease-3 [Verrucomicrobiales bacterium]
MADLASDGERYRTLSNALGYSFSDETLLDLALTHRSWCAENGDVESNERLEFLGDAVLGLSITESMYESRPEQQEGDLAKSRAEVVSTPSLATIARSLHLGSLVKLGKGEIHSGGHDKDSILADAMEAIFAAVYVDAGWEAARGVVLKQLEEAAALAQTAPGERDYKTRLQELAADSSLPAPEYEISSSGPDHGRTFVSTVRVGQTVGEGRGTSKKQAQQHAAEQALGLLDAGRTP